MAGSHEVRGSIPLGSTTDSRGARRRRRAPLFISGGAGPARAWPRRGSRPIGQKACPILGAGAGRRPFFMGEAIRIGFPARTKSASGYRRFPGPHDEIRGKKPPIPGGCRGQCGTPVPRRARGAEREGPVGLPEAAAFRYAATVRLPRRYRLAMSPKLGFMPDSLHMFSSPTMLSPTAGSFRKTPICPDRAQVRGRWPNW